MCPIESDRVPHHPEPDTSGGGELLRRSLARGLAVVTASKDLLAGHGPELRDLAGSVQEWCSGIPHARAEMRPQRGGSWANYEAGTFRVRRAAPIESQRGKIAPFRIDR